MNETDVEVSIIKSLSYLEFLIGLLEKLDEGLDQGEIRGLVFVLQDIREQITLVKTRLFDEGQKA